MRYDPDVDVLYMAKEGEEEEVIGVYAGLNVEKDSAGDLIGVDEEGRLKLTSQRPTTAEFEAPR